MASVVFDIAAVVIALGADGMPSSSTSLSSDQAFTSSIRPSYQLGSPANEAAQYAGLLYTPTVPTTSCIEVKPHIAHNLSLAMLPEVPNYIAFAPFTECWQSYLYKAISDGARAAILYQATNNSAITIPQNAFISSSLMPIYLINYQSGAPVAEAMNQYAGNLTSVPNGQDLATVFDPSSYARLWLVVTRTVSARTLPNLWIFLLIIVGVLCFLVGTTSLVLNLRQYFARRDLRRRIAAGEVDLEALGIKRLTVPRKHIEGLPQKTWKPLTASTVAGADFDQSSCAICLDDYEENVTLLRELPCHHTFHPACIDPFLEKRSSLCPLCKRSVLPKGFIPPDAQLTAATVMRERRRRRQLEQARRDGVAAPPSAVSAPETNDIELQPVAATETPTTRPGLPARISSIQLTNLAPDNEEEAAQIRRQPRWRRTIGRLFPSH